jgi:two-component system, OmpR family, sensor histidine kinase KdpD
MRGYIRAALVMAGCTAGGTVLMSWLSLTDIAMLHLLGVGVVAARASRRQAAFAAVLSVALFDFFFVPPRFTFTVSDLHYVVTFGVMLVTAFVISWLAERVREEAVATEARERGTAALAPMSAELLAAGTMGDVILVIGRQVRAAFGADVRVLLRQPGGHLATAGDKPGDAEEADRGAAEWAFRAWEPAGVGTSQFPDAHSAYLPLVGTHGRLGVLEVRPDDPDRLRDPAVQWLLRTFASHAALALERTRPASSPPPHIPPEASVA